MKIYDCFTFFNELDLLEIRLQELYPIVDKFIIVEANKTHSNKQKEFILEKNKKRFLKWWDKCIYIKVDNMPNPIFFKTYLFLSTRNSPAIKSMSYDLKIGPWRLENFQRNQIIRGLNVAKNNDLIIVGDLDEIPSSRGICVAKKLLKTHERVIFKMKHYKFYYNCLVDDNWIGTKIVKMSTLNTKLDKSPQRIRTSFKEKLFVKILHKPFLKNAYIKDGWHFSWIGNKNIIKQKIESTSHQEKVKSMSKLKQNLTEYTPIKLTAKNFPDSLVKRKNEKKYVECIIN